MLQSFSTLVILLTSASSPQSIEPAESVSILPAGQVGARADTLSRGNGQSATDPNKQVCRRISKAGSLVSRTQKICMTKQEWDERAKQYEQQAGSNDSNRSQSQCSGGYGSGYGSGC
jgi:hypothetical protein